MRIVHALPGACRLIRRPNENSISSGRHLDEALSCALGRVFAGFSRVRKRLYARRKAERKQCVNARSSDDRPKQIMRLLLIAPMAA